MRNAESPVAQTGYLYGILFICVDIKSGGELPKAVRRSGLNAKQTETQMQNYLLQNYRICSKMKSNMKIRLYGGTYE